MERRNKSLPKISIIVPVYQTEKYLERCLQSIEKQTEPNFEAILIEDGSRDKSGDICEQFASKDSRFLALHQNNEGVSAARNRGLLLARAKYITFCDSDDELCANYCRNLLSEPDKYELVISGCTIRYNDEIIHSGYDEKRIEDIKENDLAMMLGNDSLNTVWGKRFLSSIIREHNIRFDERLNLAEDTCFVAEYLINIKSIYISKNVDYIYWKRKDDNLSAVAKSDWLSKVSCANELEISILKGKFKNADRLIQWKRRVWWSYYVTIFGILEQRELNICETWVRLRDIVKSEEYKELIKDLDEYKCTDGKRTIIALKSKSAGMLLLNRAITQVMIGIKEKINNKV